MYNKYYIIYPRGDKSQLSILCLSNEMDYELSDYSVASRNSFFDEDEALDYAKNLASRNSKQLLLPKGTSDYLD